MSKSETGIVDSVGKVGVNHKASNDRSYWNQPKVYDRAKRLQEDWLGFYGNSLKFDRRRTLMRTFVTPAVLSTSSLPIEAVIPTGDEYLIYIGQNQHEPVSQVSDTRLPSQDTALRLPTRYALDFDTHREDGERLYQLWEQFGWTPQGVETFIKAGTTPIVMIRDIEDQSQVVGAMIAESLEFGHLLLVELTEMAVLPEARGHHLASHLIRALTGHVQERVGTQAVMYGEYNITTGAHRAAARAGVKAGRNRQVDGVLVDHVAINIGMNPNIQVEPWDTRYLHNFLVMHHHSQG